MAVCTNSIIHYTSTIDNLISILKNGFYPQYCRETLMCTQGIVMDVFVAMVCFCDIPFTQIGNHSKTYGKYAIGLSKEWARKNNINPVMYHCKESPYALLVSVIYQGLINISSNKKEIGVESIDLIHAMFLLMNISKNEKGILYKKNGDIIEDALLYEEREWRYIPMHDTNKGECYMFPLLDIEKVAERIERNEQLKEEKYRLTFETKDISYIVVEREADVTLLVKNMRNIFSQSPQEELERLLTKIITRDGIINDF